MPDFTVVVPYYQTNKALFESCINSILVDKDADIELLIVDDGSTAEYSFAADAFLYDSRVKVFHCTHKGVSAARNYGIDNASGTWLMFVDSDDYLESSWYSELKQYKNNKEDLIVFNGYKDSDGEETRNQFFVQEGIDYGSDEEHKLLVMESAFSIGLLPKGYLSFFSLGSPCSRLFKTVFLRENSIRFNEKISFAEDSLFALTVFFMARSIIYADKYLYHYVMHGSSVTHRYRPGLSTEMVSFFDEANVFLVENNLKDRMEYAYMYRTFHEMKRAIRLEFFHEDNPKSYFNKRRETKRFVEHEPFSSALKRGLGGEYGTIEKIEAILIKLGMYMLMTKMRTMMLRNSWITSMILKVRSAR